MYLDLSVLSFCFGFSRYGGTSAINLVDLGRVFLTIPDALSMTGSLDRPGWWLPFSISVCFRGHLLPLFSFHLARSRRLHSRLTFC